MRDVDDWANSSKMIGRSVSANETNTIHSLNYTMDLSRSESGHSISRIKKPGASHMTTMPHLSRTLSR